MTKVPPGRDHGRSHARPRAASLDAMETILIIAGVLAVAMPILEFTHKAIADGRATARAILGHAIEETA